MQRACVAAMADWLRPMSRNMPALSLRTPPVRWLVTPDDSAAAFRDLIGDGWVFWPQGEGDLGARLKRATRRAFAEGASHALLVGTDSPILPDDTLERALQLLGNAHVVLGPCEDGGYYLLGMKRYEPELFAGIAWGGADVCAQTRIRAAAAGMRCAELPTRYDLDRAADLRRAAAELARPEIPARLLPLRTLLEKVLERIGAA